MLIKKILIWILLVAITLSSGCTSTVRKTYNDDEINVYKSGKNILENYLKEDLWTKENIYDSGHVLQVPLEAAFRLENEEWKALFSEQFRRFVNDYNKENSMIDKSRLNFLQYLYLSSRFINLAYEYEELDLIPKGLIEIVYDNMKSIYFEEEAWQWDREPFINIHERILWKLKNKNVKKSYYRAIIDEELFIFAIAANLKPLYIKNGSERELKSINSILDVAYEVFIMESSFSEDGNWLFQVGVWGDHPDYKYAGKLFKSDDLTPKPVVGISSDSSHFHRFPLFIKNFIDIYSNENEKKEFFIKIQNGLEKQFLEYVLVKPNKEFDGYRLKNFMDGRNGVYRWNYVTQGKGNGYGPYELSGTFFLGWWGFLESEEITEAYGYMAEQFPLDKSLINTYVGPNTTRERNNYVKFPDFFENGFAELISRLVVKMQDMD